VPEVNFVDAHGEALSLEAFQGQVVLLNLWATWCQPCRKEMPALDRLQGQLGSPQFQVVALSSDKDGLAAVREFYTDIDVRRLDLYVDDTGEAITEVNAPGIPITLLLDLNGEELGRKLGIAEWDSEAMQGFLQQIINAGQGS
jgi:thiol-disulfide isomerase/thioredoxin